MVAVAAPGLDPLHKGALLDHGPHGAEADELLLDQRPSRLRVGLLQVLVVGGETAQSVGGVSVRQGLQDGIVDERVLLLSVENRVR